MNPTSFNSARFGNTKLKSPCVKDCPDRVAGCVKTCEKLHEYEAEKRKGYDSRNADIEKDRALDAMEVARRRRINK